MRFGLQPDRPSAGSPEVRSSAFPTRLPGTIEENLTERREHQLSSSAVLCLVWATSSLAR